MGGSQSQLAALDQRSRRLRDDCIRHPFLCIAIYGVGCAGGCYLGRYAGLAVRRWVHPYRRHDFCAGPGALAAKSRYPHSAKLDAAAGAGNHISQYFGGLASGAKRQRITRFGARRARRRLDRLGLELSVLLDTGPGRRAVAIRDANRGLRDNRYRSALAAHGGFILALWHPAEAL